VESVTFKRYDPDGQHESPEPTEAEGRIDALIESFWYGVFWIRDKLEELLFGKQPPSSIAR
jgi:hypothetical protein